jgi:hypothetical protein
MGIPLLVSMIQSDRERLHRLSMDERKSPLTMEKKSSRTGYVDQTARAQ